MRLAPSLAALGPLLSLSTAAHAHSPGRLNGHQLAQRETDYPPNDDAWAAAAHLAGADGGAHDPSPTYDAPAYEAPAATAAEYGAPAPAEWSSAADGAAYTPTSWAAEPTPTTDWASAASETYWPPASAESTPAAAGGGEGLDACLASCSASFVWPPPSAPTPTPAPWPSPSEAHAPGVGGASKPIEGGAKTHTVIVAPSQGVLRFVPFALTVKPGDTVKYQWGAGPHTVTKSSLLGICNATTVEPFTSGRLNKSATFEHVVGQSTEPTFVFCGVQPHCTKGMFSILNPPAAPANATAAPAFDPWLESMAANSTAVAAMVSKAKAEVGNQTEAWAWGSKMAVDPAMEDWAKMAAIENMLWTRMSFAANPSALVDGFSLASFNAPPSFDQISNDHSIGSGAAGHASASAPAGAEPTPAIPGSGPAASSETASGTAQTSGGGLTATVGALTGMLALAPLLFVLV